MNRKSFVKKQLEQFANMEKGREKCEQALKITKQEQTIELSIDDTIRIYDWKVNFKQRYPRQEEKDLSRRSLGRSCIKDEQNVHLAAWVVDKDGKLVPPGHPGYCVRSLWTESQDDQMNYDLY